MEVGLPLCSICYVSVIAGYVSVATAWFLLPVFVSVGFLVENVFLLLL